MHAISLSDASAGSESTGKNIAHQCRTQMTKAIRCCVVSVFLSLAYTGAGYAATINAATCSTADVQSAITSATTGDTVIIPAGTCTWTSGVTLNKGITVRGAGAGRIIAYSLSTLTLGT